ncbi:hypothetical protein LCGC14_0342520 [marine sediment metagenome]|uniref:Uncharacterized protein n=1 Tax=marine sediment metagenome TaxID=412755 RepID=A0A0F9TD86_9ZZZZ
MNEDIERLISPFNLKELQYILWKVELVTIKEDFWNIMNNHFPGEYDKHDKKAFFDKYAGRDTHVQEWCGDWWICEDDSHPITKECFMVINRYSPNLINKKS